MILIICVRDIRDIIGYTHTAFDSNLIQQIWWAAT